MTSIRTRFEKLPAPVRQWLWFIGLWLAGLGAVFALSLLIKFGMNAGG